MKRSESSLGALVLVVCGALRATVGAAPLDSVDSPLEPYDLVLRGGKIIDGSGNPWMFGDLAIRGDRIAAVGQVPQAPSRREIDARGLVVSPGFIDMHSHSDFLLLEDGNAQSKIRQGVTTEVLGEGSSAGPYQGKLVARKLSAGGRAAQWTTLGGYFDAVLHAGVAVNVVSYVGLD